MDAQKLCSPRNQAQLPAWLLCLAVAWALESQVAVSSLAAGPSALAAHTRDQLRLLHEEKISRTPAQRKLDSQLVYALRQKRLGFVAPGLARLRPGALAEQDGRLLVDLNATVTPDLIEFIARSGGLVVNSFPRYGAIRAWVSWDTVELLAARRDVRSIRPADTATTNSGGLPVEGDIAHRADAARSAFLATGSGIKIGVLSDSVDYLSQAQAAGALPQVMVLPGQEGFGSGEGTAMLEIVHALAPGAPLYFATAVFGVASFAQNIRDLQAAGCQIIVDDVRYFNESPFFDGPIAQAVNDVSAAGALFFSSAGNSGNKDDNTAGTWEGDFRDGGLAAVGKTGRLHDFGGTTYNTVLPGGGFRRVDLFWSDPPGRSTNDYDLYVIDSSGAVVRSSNNFQVGNNDPYEVIPGLSVGERIIIVKFSGEDRYLSLTTGRGILAIATPGNVRGHNAVGAPNAFSVAATRATSPPIPFVGGTANPVETFSSDGPRRVFFNADGSPITPGNFSATGGAVLQKPDITAADGVSTTVPGFELFRGTSAAAPHAAAIASLLWSFQPDLTPLEIRTLLTSTALDIGAPGVDRDSGSGIVMADSALGAVTPRPWLRMGNIVFNDANANGRVDPNECAEVRISLQNLPGPARGAITGITAVLTTARQNVVVDPAVRVFPDLAAGVSGTSTVPFRISTSPNFVCGTNVDFVLHVTTSNQINFTFPFQISSIMAGLDTPALFTSTNVPIPIPDLATVESGVNVTGISRLLGRVRVGLHLTHTYDFDLRLSLLAPDGTEILLSENNGGTGHDYGADCNNMTEFFDDAAGSIDSGTAPFVGEFQPLQPLTLLNGKSGAAVNGTWRLRVRDEVGLDSGTLQCWRLELSPIKCIDGGGECLVPPRIVQEPTDQIGTNGATARLTVQAQGTDPLNYQWFFNQTNRLSGATNADLVFSNVSAAQAGSYSVIVTNFYGGVTSGPAYFAVLVPATIVSGPTNVVATNGGTVQFSVVAAGTEPLSYQWFFQSTQMITSAIFSGATTPVLVISNVSPARAGLYSVEVSNLYGGQVSTSAILAVVAGPPFSCGNDRTVELGTAWDFDPPTVTGTNVTVAVLNTTTNPACGDAYSATRSWVVTYGGGLHATCSQTIRVVDTQRPVIACAPDKTVSDGAVWTFDAPTARDAGVVDQLVYDNSVNDLLYRFDPGLVEVGDEIILGGVSRHLSRFSFEFWGANSTGGDFEGNVQARVRFYRNDGPLSVAGFATPGTVIFDSGSFAIPALAQATLVFEDFQVDAVVPLVEELPPALTWTVQFSGLSPNDSAGLDLYSPPVVGESYRDYWELDGGQWRLKSTAVAAIDFAARFEAVSRGVTVTTLGTVTNAGCGNSFTATRTWRASDACSNEVSCSQTVTVRDTSRPVIVSQPVDQVVVPGGAVVFSVSATGCPPLSYQWIFNETNFLADATNAMLTLSNVTSAQAGFYAAVVSNANGEVTSLSANLTIAAPPTITQQPQSQTVVRGGSAQFEVTAEGTIPLTFQWYLDCTNPIPAATQAALTFTNVTFADGGNYCVVVSDVFGTVTSQSALLRVLAAPEFLSISRAGPVVSIRFSTVSGLLYTVQYNDTLGPGGWVPLQKGFRQVGTGLPLTVPDPNTRELQRFYRILVE